MGEVKAEDFFVNKTRVATMLHWVMLVDGVHGFGEKL